jgi:hypothetical protein
MPRKSKSARAKAAKPYQVFVSHATADKWLARVFCDKIAETGATTFRDDRDIDGGDNIPDTLRRQIKASKEVLVLLTPKSVGRPWVTLEVGAAWGHGPRVRIVVITYHVTADQIPAMIQSNKAIELNDFDLYLNELAGRVRAYHG